MAIRTGNFSQKATLFNTRRALVVTRGTGEVRQEPPEVVETPPVTQLQITTDSLPDAQEGSSYSPVVLTRTGGGPSGTWLLETGTIPTGMTWTAGTATLSGTPTVLGNYSLGFKFTDNIGNIARRTLTLFVKPIPVAITSETALPDITVGSQFSVQFQASGGKPPYHWTVIAGSLPAGTTLSDTGVWSGSPTGSGSVSFTLQVADETAGTPLTANKAFTGTAFPMAQAPGTDRHVYTTADWLNIMAPASGVVGGDRVWVRGPLHGGPAGGLYNNFTTRPRWKKAGTAQAKIDVRPYQDARIIFDIAGCPFEANNGEYAFRVEANYVRFYDFEFTDSLGLRYNGNPASVGAQGFFNLGLSQGLSVSAKGIEFINFMVYDLGQGIFVSDGSHPVYLYGGQLFHNGFDGARNADGTFNTVETHGHGHAYYLQGSDPNNWSVIDLCTAYGNFYTNGKAYGTVTSANNYRWIRFTSVDAGAPFFGPRGQNNMEALIEFASGSAVTIDDGEVIDSVFFAPEFSNGNGMKGWMFFLGFVPSQSGIYNRRLAIQGCWILGGQNIIDWKYWANCIFRNNLVFIRKSTQTPINLNSTAPLSGHDWDFNEYWSTTLTPQGGAATNANPANEFALPGTYAGLKPFRKPITGTETTNQSWRGLTGFDANSNYNFGVPSTPRIRYNRNQHWPGQKGGKVDIWNPGLAATVSVDLANLGAVVGESYRLRTHENPLVDHSTVNLSSSTIINLPMTGHTPKVVRGLAYTIPTRSPEFLSWVIKRI